MDYKVFPQMFIVGALFGTMLSFGSMFFFLMAYELRKKEKK